MQLVKVWYREACPAGRGVVGPRGGRWRRTTCPGKAAPGQDPHAGIGELGVPHRTMVELGCLVAGWKGERVGLGELGPGMDWTGGQE